MFKSVLQTIARFKMNYKIHTCTADLSNCKPKPRVLQKIADIVHPSAKINIKSNIFTTIDSFSIHANLNCDDFQVSLIDKSPEENEDADECSEKDAKAEFFVCIDDDKEDVQLNIQKYDENADIYCEIHLPHNCSIIMNSTDAVSVSRIFGTRLTVRAAKDIELRTIRFQNILLSTDCGKIKAQHILLGGIIQMDTKNSNSIELGNVIGSKMFLKTDGGNISTTSCFVEESKFESNTGCFRLNNLHKHATIIANKEANIDIRGVRGRLDLLGKSTGTLNLHMSKIFGECRINCNKFETASLYVSDSILKSVDINVVSDCLTLDESLEKQSKDLSNDKKKFHSKRKGNNKLIMNTKQAAVTMGLISWAESVLGKKD